MYTEVKNFCGQTAGGILKTAHIARNNSGAWHVYVTTKNRGEYEVAMTEFDEMVMRDYADTIVMPVSDSARAKLERMLDEADDRMTAEYI